MIDYLFNFADEDAAIAALPEYYFEDEYGGKSWVGGALPVRVIMQSAIYDESLMEVQPEIASPGFWVGISSDEPSSDLWGLPNCVAEMNRETGNIIQLRGFDLDAINSIVTISPTWADRRPYPWGSFEIA